MPSSMTPVYLCLSALTLCNDVLSTSWKGEGSTRISSISIGLSISASSHALICGSKWEARSGRRLGWRWLRVEPEGETLGFHESQHTHTQNDLIYLSPERFYNYKSNQATVQCVFGSLWLRVMDGRAVQLWETLSPCVAASLHVSELPSEI